MYRLLIVDDEEIITDSLYEVFNQLMPDDLDVCKAYSAREALGWLSRTRIDIVLTDIRMPGMTGLELTDEIQNFWPRCRLIYLTGHSEFNYAYQAMKVPNIRYLLKTEGYSKVIQTVQEVIEEIRQGEQLDELIAKSRQQVGELELMWQSDYFRHLIGRPQEHEHAVLEQDFRRLNIGLDTGEPVVMALGQFEYPEGLGYLKRRELLASVRWLWHSYLAERTRSIGIEDKYGDLLWFIQPSGRTEDQRFNQHFMRYLEGTLELIQHAAKDSLGLTLTFVIGKETCGWSGVSEQYERLHLLQHLRFGNGLPVIITDRQSDCEDLANKDALRMKQKVEILASQLDAGKSEEFFAGFDELMMTVLQLDANNAQLVVETYYAVSLSLLGHIIRWGLHGKIGEYSKLMRFDDHASFKDGFLYLYRIAERIFDLNRISVRDRTTKIIDRICDYIVEHLSEDLSLVRLAELHYFNPSYLSRLFKQERGLNLSEYIDHCRIKKAKELLEDRDLKVREVAVSVGYEAAHSFSRFFKKATGMTPQEYRDQLVKGG